MKLLEAAKSTLRAWVARMPRWDRIASWVVWAAVVLFLLVAVVWGYWAPRTRFGAWTGFGEFTRPKAENQEYQRPKTLWDWMGLLIVPVVLAVGGYWLNQRRESLSRKIEDERRKEERKLERDRLREEALQRYFDRMADLMLEKDLRTSKPDDLVRDIARAGTLAVLRGLDGARRGALLRFLHESELIAKDKEVISLQGANVSWAHLSGADLRGANLREANLRRGKLSGVDLRGADLWRATLVEADLFGAKLSGADLSEVGLDKAILVGADLVGSRLHSAILSGASLSFANLSGAELIGTDLSGADLRLTDGLTQDQLNWALGDEDTKLPEGLNRPELWSKPAAT
jgi:uncharacterized protein YjbI with pentapeptide repeats